VSGTVTHRPLYPRDRIAIFLNWWLVGMRGRVCSRCGEERD